MTRANEKLRWNQSIWHDWPSPLHGKAVNWDSDHHHFPTSLASAYTAAQFTGQSALVTKALVSESEE